MKNRTILQYFEKSPKPFRSVTSKNSELESPKSPMAPNDLEVVSSFFKKSSNSNTNAQLLDKNPVASTSAYSVSHKVNKLPSSHHGLVRESDPMVNEREENTNKMNLSISKVPQVSPQGNYQSRNDQTTKDGSVASTPALSECDESSNDVLGEQTIQLGHGGKVGVPNQTNINASERTNIGTKKEGFGVLHIAIVEYMERYGDISKCYDKVLRLQKWEQLKKTLNAKTNTNWSVDQWKRKWGYMRSNATKMKADIASGLAGGADGNSVYKLADLARVLKIIESPVVTDAHDVEDDDVALIAGIPVLSENLVKPATQALLPVSPTHTTNVHPEIPCEQVIQTDESRESSQVDHEEDRAVESTTYTQHTPAGPQRRRFTRRRWRSAQENFHTLLKNFGTKYIRLRRLELEQRTQFTTLFAKFVDLLENLRNSET